MPWESIEQVPEQIRNHQHIPLTLEQANKWAEIFDAVQKEGIVENPGAIAWSTWMKLYKVSEDGKSWMKISEEQAICPECKNNRCISEKVFSSSMPRLYQLSEKDADRTGESELLMLFGTAIAEGEWKNVIFSEKVLKDALERVTNKRIDVEHEDETWSDVKGFIFKPKWNEKLKGIDVSGTIFDERVINWYKNNPNQKIGWSVKMSDDAKYDIKGDKKICTYFDIKGIALTLNPACKVCWVNESETVQLSSSENNNKISERGEKMVDETKTITEEQPKPELKEQPKEEIKKEAKAPVEAAEMPTPPGAVTTPPKEEVTAQDVTALTKMVSELMKRVEMLEKENSALSKEKELSETKTMVDGLISSGKLSEAKREAATIALNALSGNDAKNAFLSAVGDGNWKSSERGIVLSEEKKEEAPQFSEPVRNVIT